MWRVASLGVLAACGRWGFSPSPGDGALGDGATAGSGGSDGGVMPDGTPGDAATVAPDAPAGTQLPPANADTYIKGIDNTTHGADLMSYVGRYSGSGTNMFVLLQFDLTGVTGSPATRTTAS